MTNERNIRKAQRAKWRNLNKELKKLEREQSPALDSLSRYLSAKELDQQISKSEDLLAKITETSDQGQQRELRQHQQQFQKLQQISNPLVQHNVSTSLPDNYTRILDQLFSTKKPTEDISVPKSTVTIFQELNDTLDQRYILLTFIIRQLEKNNDNVQMLAQLKEAEKELVNQVKLASDIEAGFSQIDHYTADFPPLIAFLLLFPVGAILGLTVFGAIGGLGLALFSTVMPASASIAAIATLCMCAAGISLGGLLLGSGAISEARGNISKKKLLLEKFKTLILELEKEKDTQEDNVVARSIFAGAVLLGIWAFVGSMGLSFALLGFASFAALGGAMTIALILSPLVLGTIAGVILGGFLGGLSHKLQIEGRNKPLKHLKEDLDQIFSSKEPSSVAADLPSDESAPLLEKSVFSPVDGSLPEKPGSLASAAEEVTWQGLSFFSTAKARVTALSKIEKDPLIRQARNPLIATL